jgi:23S rRNA (adenine2503-C2)-methyltransferase
MPISVHDEAGIKALLSGFGEKPFRYAQIAQAAYKDLVPDIPSITTISKELREKLASEIVFSTLSLRSEETSDNGQTTKFLFETHDGKLIESVIMRHLSGRNTLCVSCQAGCPMGCSFCATGKLGLFRNLTAWEILEQFDFVQKRLVSEDRKIRNVVFMGMGEPFLNYENLKMAILVLCDQKKYDVSNRRITVSTCGIVPGIEKFAEDFPQVSLAVSLHAPNDETRKSIMPVENTYPLADLMASLDRYVEKTNKRVFYEYIMISGVTDHPRFATELAELLRGRLAHVNFIPYNPGEGIMGNGMLPTSKLLVKKFQDTLEKAGIPSTVRHTMGDDIDAACGQLAMKEKGESLATETGKSISKAFRKGE